MPRKKKPKETILDEPIEWDKAREKILESDAEDREKVMNLLRACLLYRFQIQRQQIASPAFDEARKLDKKEPRGVEELILKEPGMLKHFSYLELFALIQLFEEMWGMKSEEPQKIDGKQPPEKQIMAHIDAMETLKEKYPDAIDKLPKLYREYGDR